MDLKNITLDEWLKSPPVDAFYQSKPIDYISLYNTLNNYLTKNVHKYVNMGATLSDPEIYLNDHGPEHISTVISRATELVANDNCILSAYEVYILLCCIQIHDTGNILGRYKHEEKSEEIIKKAKNLCGRNTIEERSIYNIAASHGGMLDDGNKDKISELPFDSPTPDGGEYKPGLIASILRIADELADDMSRADLFQLEKGTIPKGSQVFHVYSSCLYPPKIDHENKCIRLKYVVPMNYLTQKFGKKDKNRILDIYLIDEIYLRLTKMYNELIYCMRFSCDSINFNKILIEIEFYSDNLRDTKPNSIFFEVCEKGYPNKNLDIFKITDNKLLDNDGKKMNGEYFYEKYKT